MFSHADNNSYNELSTEDVMNETDKSDDKELFSNCENQCHLCRKKLKSKDDLWDHVETEHGEYFYGMLEVAAYLSNTKNDTE